MASDDQDFVLLEHQDLADFNTAGLLPQSPEIIDQIIKWLQPTDYTAESSEYNKHLATYVPGTGVWIQESAQYQQWLTQDSGALWIKATAGAGKSVIAAHVASLLAGNENVPVLSFFFRQIIATNRTPQALIRDWLAQLLRFSPPLQKKLKELLDQRRALETLALDELWDFALSAMASFKRAYCVVDALDEMDGGQEEFMRKLVRLAQEKSSSIKLLLTSRPLPHIEKVLSNPHITHLHLRPQLVDRDIAIYIRERLLSTHFPSEARAAIEDVLGRKSQGLFLYTRLMLDEILEEGFTNIRIVQNALEELPSGLGEMYTQMLSDHATRSGTPQDLQLFILKCVTHSSRPLRLLELSTLVDFVRKSPRTAFAPNVPPSTLGTKAIVRTGCGPLLEILEDETVSIIHHSLTEYLTSSQTVGRSLNFCHIDSKDAHLDIAKTCIDYLLSDGLSDWDATQCLPADKQNKLNIARLTHPFLDYSTKHWAYHALKCEKNDEDLFELLDLLLGDTKRPIFAAYHEVTDPQSSIKNESALHIAAFSGLAFYTRHLLEAGHNANFQNRQQRTPLHVAANNGFEDVVEELVKHGVELCKDEYSGYTPIHLAACANRKMVVRVLLKAGVSPLERRTHDDPGNWCGNARHDGGVTPLQYACEYGHTETVPEFFPYLDEESLSRALMWALQYGKVETAAYILENSKVDVNRIVNNKTAIHIAAWSHDLASIAKLIARGANVKLGIDDRYDFMYSHAEHGPRVRSTPFKSFLQFSRGYPVPFLASPEDSFEILKIFVGAGCDLNEKDKSGQTAFHNVLNGIQRMPSEMSREMIQYMFANGADSSILTKDGSTALHLMPCHLDSAIESLVAGGIDVNSRRTSDGRTPLFGAVGSEEYVSMFVKLGADCNIKDLKGDTPLQVAVRDLGYSKNPKGDAAIKALLAAGADPKIKNKAGLAPIHTLSGFRAHNETFLALMAAGASLESRTDTGHTVLISFLNGRQSYDWDLQILLDAGADIDARDFAGKGALHYCCEKDKGTDFLRKFVDAGADPSVRDYAGNTLFHQAARQGPSYNDKEQLAFLEKLLELGVDPRATNHAGQTPVHIAVGNRSSMSSSNYKTDPLDFLLGPKCNVDINAQDNSGIRAIHLAAALGEDQVKQVLEKGADSKVVTLQGQTALHVASRLRQCNVVGLLTDLYLKEEKAEMLDQVDVYGRTALHYAARSGRPESVAILVNIGGADVNANDSKNLTALHMCAHIEEEQIHWTPEVIGNQQEAYIAAAGVQMGDPYRPTAGFYGNERRGCPSSRELIRFLIEHGANIAVGNVTNRETKSGGRAIAGLLAYALKTDSEVLVDVLLDVEKSNLICEAVSEPKLNSASGSDSEDDDDLHPWISSEIQIDQFQVRHSACRLQNVDFLEGMVTPGEDNISLFRSLLSEDHEKGILQMKALGADMLKPEIMGDSCLTILIKGGYASLLGYFGEEIAKMDEEWIKETEQTNSNLPGRLFLPILIASQSSLPNLEVLKVLVGTFGVDVNVQFQQNRFYAYNEGKGALHILASCTHSWHTHAIKYLLENGANPNIQDKDGNTPLHIAVKSSSDIAVSHLLSHSANLNLLNNDQLTPLTAFKSSTSIISLLVSHGANVLAGAKPFIFRCIEAEDLSTIRLLISMKTDLNVRLPPEEEPPIVEDNEHAMRQSIWAQMEYETREEAENSFPVHFAAGRKFNTPEMRERMIPIIEALLKGGADPMLAFNDAGDGIINDICVRGGILAPFLEIPDLDVEVRDSKGRTLLLCACTTDKNWYSSSPQLQSLPSDVSLLLERGADITAVDKEGRNVLYHLLTSSEEGKNMQAHHPSDFDTILAHPLASQLVAQKDTNGITALQHALKMGQFSLVNALLTKGADPLEKEGEGNTALHNLAAQAEGKDFLDLTFMLPCFEEQGGDSDDAREYSEPTTITSLFAKFLSLGVDINVQNKAGETCLFRFVAIQEVGVHHLKFFDQHGADFSVVNAKGQNLLHACAKGGEISGGMNRSGRTSEVFEHWDAVNGVLREGAGVKGYKGVDGKAGMFKWLMEVKGLDPLAEDGESRSALDVATASGCVGILELFRRKDN